MITAKEFLENHSDYNGFEHPDIKNSVIKQMIEFAKFHCKEQLKSITDSDGFKNASFKEQDSILNAYPLFNII